jgi:hypothetical protein
MAITVEKLVSQALSLPSDSRAKLAEKIVESLENEEIKKIWLSEAKKRRDEVRSGRVKPIEGEEVLRQVKNLINK